MLLNFLIILLLLQNQPYPTLSKLVPPPLPILPIPTSSQLKWQRRELIMFFHFGVNTFTNSEWGTGKESPSIFNPANLNAKQWVNAAADAGFSLVILTAKHHDGFCLWPSKYTDHSVKYSPWKDGKGDVVQEFAEAAAERGIDMGLYLSPWDRHERSYGDEVQYNEYYLGQLQELLTSYGTVEEIWFDGAKGKNAKNMAYHFDNWFSRAKELQGYINIFSDAGPDIRWVGDEGGAAGTTCWSTINRTLVSIGTGKVEYLNKGDAKGVDWVPPECDVSIRRGWFWHADQSPKTLTELLTIYYSSVGRNCVLLLNVPPNTSGLLSNSDIERLKEFHKAIGTIFSTDFAKGSIAKASSQRGGKNGGFSAMNVLDSNENSYWAPGNGEEEGYWIELTKLNPGKKFNVVRIQEAFWMGQRVKRHVVYADGRVIANGTTVGHKRLHRLRKAVAAESVKVQILEWKGLPLLSAVGLHFDPFVVTLSRYEWGDSNNTNATKANSTVLF